MKACPVDRNFGRGRSAAGLHASPDSFYRTARDERQRRPGVTAIALRLLPRRCPLCGNRTIIGHGRRRKQAHDQRHDWIWIRRGRCQPCRKTFTILPDWSLPYSHYTLRCRQRAWESVALEVSAQTAVKKTPRGALHRRGRCPRSWSATAVSDARRALPNFWGNCSVRSKAGRSGCASSIYLIESSRMRHTDVFHLARAQSC